jgi:hypothetical protein
VTPREYLNLVVKPNVEEFIQDVSDPRRAYNAIATADALAAHVFYWCKKNAPDAVHGIQNDDAYRMLMQTSRPNIGLVHDVAKALKHVEMNNKTSKIRTEDEVQARSFGFGEGAYGVGPYGGTPQQSVLIDGRKIQLQLNVEHAVDFYEKEMDRLGIP